MDDENKTNTGVLDEELQRELKIFLAGKPGGYQYIRAFIRDAVREKMVRMKDGAKE